MNPVKVNSKTGQIAVARGTEPRADAVTIYNPGEYKINPMKGQIAIPTPDGKYEIHALTPEQSSALMSPDALLRRQTGMVGSGVGEKTTGEGESALRGAQQGVTLNLSDEIGGLTSAAMANAQGRPIAKDPQHPVTGGMTTDLLAQYLNQVQGERADNQAALESSPKIFKSAQLAGSIIPSAALPAARALPAIGFGAAQGAVQGAGGADTQDLKGILFNTMIGAGGGAAGGAMGSAANKIFAANTPSGMAFNAIDQASPNGIKALAGETAQAGGSAAEHSPVLADVLRNYSEQAPKTAASLVGPAASRMAQVNKQAVGEVDRMLSPENAILYLKNVKQAAKAANGPAYDAARASPVRVGLPMEVQNQPVFKDALKAAQSAAENEFPPRQIDPANLSAGDIDLVDRMLRTMKAAAEKSQGDTSEAAIKAQATLPAVAQRQADTRFVADQAFPELKTARDQAAVALQKQEALKLGGQALAPGREAVEIAAEYSALSPHQQEAYRVGIATKLRAMLASKGSASNVGQVFDKTGLADKLVAVGFPQETVDKIVKGGMSARSVLNALTEGSDTAQKLLAAEAGKSPLSKIKPMDLVLAAVGNIATMGGVKVANEVGKKTEQGAAKRVVEALAAQGPDALKGLIFNSPQSAAAIFNVLARTGGANSALSIFPARGGQ